MSRVALGLLAVPVSSAVSERDFSSLKNIGTSERNRLKDDIIEDNAFNHSLYSVAERAKGQSGWSSTSQTATEGRCDVFCAYFFG